MLACLGYMVMLAPVAVVFGEEVVEPVDLVSVNQPVYDHVGPLVGAVGGQGEHAVYLQPRQQPSAGPGHGSYEDDIKVKFLLIINIF